MSDKAPAPNSAQQKAIETINGPVLLLAGPGTGKTFTLTERILFLLRKGVEASRILALTFTENAAREMHQRLVVQLGLIGHQVPIFTFHGFCQRLIRQFPDIFEMPADIRVIEDVTRFQMIREILESKAPQFLKTERGDVFYYVREIVHKISLVKREAIAAPAFQAAVDEFESKAQKELQASKSASKTARAQRSIHMAGKLREFWEIYDRYNHKLSELGFMDYEDMILRVVDRFRKCPDFLDDVRERYDFIHADEFQDNNSAQNEILYALAGDEPNLFVVGDDDQSIFRFQGACAENMLDFIRRFPCATVITLNENHRSTPSILDFSYGLMSQGKNRLEKSLPFPVEKRLQSSNPRYQSLLYPIRVVRCADRWNETEWIATEIVRLREEDPTLEWKDFAILFRLNKEASEISNVLRRHAIPYKEGVSENALASPVVHNLLSLLKAIVEPSDSTNLAHALSFPSFKISFSDLYALNQSARSRGVPLWNLLEQDLESLNLRGMDRFVAFRDQMILWRTAFREKTLFYGFLDVVHQSGLFEFYLRQAASLSPDPIAAGTVAQGSNTFIQHQALEAVRRFTRFVQDFNQVHPKANLSDLLNHIGLAETYGIPIEIEGAFQEKESRVQLLTAHKAKGSEFRVVFVTNVCALVWEDRRPPRDLIAIPTQLILKNQVRDICAESDEAIEDERRLMYVSMTRARERLYLTRPMVRDGQLLDESVLVSSMIHHPALETLEVPPMPSLYQYQQEFAPKPVGTDLVDFLRDRTRSLSLSPTAIRQYENCPRQFLYTYIYLIPKKIEREMVYGYVVHEALRSFFNSVKQHQVWPSVEELIEPFLQILKGQLLESVEDYKTLETLGRKELSEFYEWCLQNKPPHVIGTEMSLKNILLKPSEALSSESSEILLGGKFDRVDLGAPGQWTVVDYKTGKPRSENEFFGRTKNGDGDYWDQFRFYKLINQLAGQTPITRGKVIYLREPEKSHEFDLTQQDAEEVQKKIEAVNSKIRSLAFQPVSENQSAEVCRRCSYIRLCKAKI